MGSEQTRQISLSPYPSKIKNISFGGEKEKEMIQKFNAFDILWYADKDSEKLENWIAFTNVIVQRTSDINEFAQLAFRSRLFNLIIITTGSYAEKAIPLISPELLIPNIIIYCMNAEYHKKWSEEYKSVIGVCTLPNQIFKHLLTIQNAGYNIPSFNYKIKYGKELNFNFYDPLLKIEWKSNEDNFFLNLNKYEKFCVQALSDYRLSFVKEINSFTHFKTNSKFLFDLFYAYIPFLFSFEIETCYYEELNFNLMGLTLLSLYFSKLPYLYSLLNYSEIESILNNPLNSVDLVKDYILLCPHLKVLVQKLEMEKVSILDETVHLKFLQIFLLKYCKIFTKMVYDFDEFSKYPIMIKYLEDIDFCLKYFFFRTYGRFKDPIYHMRCKGTLDDTDKRIVIFYIYSSFKKAKEKALKNISKEEFDVMNKTLIIKDFIVIGNKKFHNNIKTIETDIIHKKIAYLSMNQVRDYLKNEISKNIKYRSFSYIIIIKAQEAENHFNELVSLKHDFTLKIILIIFIDNINLLINKKILLEISNIPTFFAYNINEIKNYIISQENCSCGRNFIEYLQIKKKI